MATMNTTIEHIDSTKPNAYGETEKYQWIARLEGMIIREVLEPPEPELNEAGELVPVEHHIPVVPDDADRELLVPFPYDDLYALYVASMIDFYNREYQSYNNTAAVFADRLDAFKRWYIRHNAHGRAVNFRNVN